MAQEASHEILARPGRPAIAYRRLPAREGGAARPGIVFLGGFTSDMTGTKAEWLEGFARARGLAYVRFDYTGHGRSEGTMAEGTIGGWLEDALDVLDILTRGPQVLVGSSMGGWLALLAALRRPERVTAIVGVAAAPDFTEELIWNPLDDGEKARLMAEGRIEQPGEYGEAPYLITRGLIEEARGHLLLGAPIAVNCPVRLLHGLADADVPWQTALRLAERLTTADVTVILAKGGTHRLSEPRDLEHLTALVAETVAG